MKKQIIIVLITAIIFSFYMNSEAVGIFQEEKKTELDQLDKRAGEAYKRIEESSTIRAGDFLKLLPNLGVSRHASESEVQESENYYSASISTSQIFDINDRQNKREGAKLKARRKVESYKFRIRKLIEKKYLILSKIWKLKQIKKAQEDPIEVAKLDDRIDEQTLSLQEVEIEIENSYAEIEYTCVEVEKG